MTRDVIRVKYRLLVAVIVVAAGVMLILFKMGKQGGERGPDDMSHVVTETLQDGRICRATLYYDRMDGGVIAALRRVEIQVDDEPVYVPRECFTDLANLSVEGVQIADFAQDIFLLLSAEQHGAPCDVKITVRNQRVVERHVQRAVDAVQHTTYNQPFEIGYVKISDVEKAKYLRKQSDEVDKEHDQP